MISLVSLQRYSYQLCGRKCLPIIHVHSYNKWNERHGLHVHIILPQLLPADTDSTIVKVNDFTHSFPSPGYS